MQKWVYRIVIPLLLLHSIPAFNQCPDPGATSDGLNEFVSGNPCAIENKIWWRVQYNNVTLDESIYDVYFQFEWGDGDVDYYRATGSNNLFGTTFRSWQFTTPNTETNPALSTTPDQYAYKDYLPGLNVCRIDLNTSLVVVPDGAAAPIAIGDGIACNDTRIDRFIAYWDEEDQTTGEIEIDEPDSGPNDDVVQVCAGQEVLINPFTDGSTFNCVDPAVTNKNNGDRWYQWVYNTTNFPNNISNIELVDAGNTVVATLNNAGYTGEYEDNVQYDPAPLLPAERLVTQANESFRIRVPATANVGDLFEIKLHNWNPCNPFDDPSTGPSPSLTSYLNGEFNPVETTVTIEVVAGPDPNPQVQDPDNPAIWLENSDTPRPSYCVDEIINFRQDPTITPEGSDVIQWDFDYDGTTFNVDATGPIVSTSYNNTYVGTTVDVAVRITRGSVGIPCEFIELIDIEISDGPVADFNVSSSEGCELLSLTATDNSTSADLFNWSIDQISGVGAASDAGVISTSIPGGSPQFTMSGNTVDFQLGNVGEYEITLNAASTTATSCPSTITQSVFVYDNPVANFDADNVCDGEDVTFVDNSSIPTVINGDNIEEWEWDYDYDGVTFTVDETFTGSIPASFQRNIGSVGTYTVALRVRTELGACESTIFTRTVEVLPRPDAQIAIVNDPGGPVCPSEIIFENTSTDPLITLVPVDEYDIEIFNVTTGTVEIYVNNIGGPGATYPYDFTNTSGVINTFEISIIAEGTNNCNFNSVPVTVEILPSEPSDFSIFEDTSLSTPYDAASSYCSPGIFYYQMDTPTRNLLNPGDSTVWTILDGSDTVVTETVFEGVNEDVFLPTDSLFNGFPNNTFKTFVVSMQPYVNGVCVAETQRSVRVLPEPTAAFDLLDSTDYCDSVTYIFEAVQNGLTQYNWKAEPNADTLSTATFNSGEIFQVTYLRGTTTDIPVEVGLQTVNPFLCVSDSTFWNNTVPERENVTVVWSIAASGNTCSPAEYTIQNISDTTLFPSGTQWRLVLDEIDTVLGNPVIASTTILEPDNSNPAFINAFDTTFNSPGVYELRLEAETPTSCVAAVGNPEVFEVFPSPIADLSITPKRQGCPSEPLDFTITDISQPNGSTISQVRWTIRDTFNGVDSLSNVTQPSTWNYTFFNPTSDTIVYEVEIRVESTNGCVSTSIEEVTVFPEPQIDFDLLPAYVKCEDGPPFNGEYTFQLDLNDAFFANNPLGTIYEINWGDGTSNLTDADTIISHSYINNLFQNDSNYAVTVTAQTPAGCNFSVAKNVVLLANVDAAFNIPIQTPVCSNLSIPFTYSGGPQNVDHFYEYRVQGSGPWISFDSIPEANGNITQVFTNSTGSPITYEVRHTVTLQETLACSDTRIRTFVVNPIATGTLANIDGEVCINGSATLEISLTGIGPWVVRYEDNFGNLFTRNFDPPAAYDPQTDTAVFEFEQQVFGDTTNVFTLSEVRDSNIPRTCAGLISGTARVDVNDIPVGDISQTTTICEGENATITFDLSGNGPFDVDILEGQDTVRYTAVEDGDTYTVSPPTTTNYRLIYIDDVNGCEASPFNNPITVFVNNRPSSEIIASDTICFGSSSRLTFNQTGIGPWTITYTDGTNDSTFTTSLNQHTIAVSPEETTTYSLVSVEDINCTGTVSGTANIFVYPFLDVSFTATPETTSLPNSEITFVNTTTNINEWDFEWEFGNGGTSTEVNPGTYDYGTYGTFVVRLTATNGQCTDFFERVIEIGAIPPVVDFDAEPTEGCFPHTVTFRNLTLYADKSSYVWDFGDGQTAFGLESPEHTYTRPGKYTVTLSANNITGQRRQVVKEEYIEVFETPQASFTIPEDFRQVFTGDEVEFVNTSTGADEFTWYFGDGNTSFEQNTVHNYADSGIYDIQLVALNTTTGCTDTFALEAQVRVLFGGEARISNAFTPSRAGPNTASQNQQANDIFLPLVSGVSDFDLKIYNRWGELLFESKDQSVGWDGYYKGELMPQGVYVYRLEVVYENGRRETTVGDVTLIR